MTQGQLAQILAKLTTAKQYNAGVPEWTSEIHLPCHLNDLLVDFLGKVRHMANIELCERTNIDKRRCQHCRDCAEAYAEGQRHATARLRQEAAECAEENGLGCSNCGHSYRRHNGAGDCHACKCKRFGQAKADLEEDGRCCDKGCPHGFHEAKDCPTCVTQALKELGDPDVN